MALIVLIWQRLLWWNRGLWYNDRVAGIAASQT